MLVNRTANAAPRGAGPVHFLNLNSWSRIVEHLWSKYRGIFAGAYILTLIIYSYLFTTITFTNHTLPNVWINPYPSFKTFQEGRWFADFLIRLAGGSGVQALQMAIAAGVQIVNALLFAELLNVDRKYRIFIFAAFLALHPTFLDYYSFATDHLSFTFGDTLVLLGVFALDRCVHRRTGAGLAILCFVLALATYPPKVAFIATLLLIWCLPRDRDFGGDRGGADYPLPRRQSILIRILTGGAVFVTAGVLYYISTKLTVTETVSRNQINTIYQIYSQLAIGYLEIFTDFTIKVDYLPGVIWWLPAASIVIGCVAILWTAVRESILAFICSIVLIALFPVALRLSYLVNDETWPDVGRILAPQAYFLLFFLASAWSLPRVENFISIPLLIFIYYFGVIGSQETNAAAIKHIYEIERINRLVARIEEQVPDIYQKQYPVVVVGEIELHPEVALKRFSRKLYDSQLNTPTFELYRQTQILNYFLGSEQIILPTKRQEDAVVAGIGNKRPWPAPESVYVQDGVIVVLLQPYAPNTAAITMTQ